MGFYRHDSVTLSVVGVIEHTPHALVKRHLLYQLSYSCKRDSVAIFNNAKYHARGGTRTRDLVPNFIGGVHFTLHQRVTERSAYITGARTSAPGLPPHRKHLSAPGEKVKES